MPAEYYDRDFPDLNALGYEETSPPAYYNCVAFAAGDERRRWWPGEYPPVSGDYWPVRGVEEETPEVFVAAFATLGYAPCPSGELEDGYEKVAFYVLRGVVTHAARQGPDGSWKSKLGPDEDIRHTLAGLEGPAYGRVGVFVRRRRDSVPAESPTSSPS